MKIYLLIIILGIPIIFNCGCYSKFDRYEATELGIDRHHDNDYFFADENSEHWEHHDWTAEDEGLEAEDWQD